MEEKIIGGETSTEQLTGLEQLAAMEKAEELQKRATAGDLYTAFFRIGLCTYGGDRAMLPHITRVCVEEQQWVTAEEMAEVEEVAATVPGPMALSLVTSIGWRQSGFGGALAAALGMITPGVLIIYLVSLFLDTLMGLPVIFHAFRGLQAAVGILILDAAFSMLWRMEKKLLPILIFFGTAILMLLAVLRVTRLSVVTLLLAAAALSLGIYGARGAFGDEETEKKKSADNAKNGDKSSGRSGGAKTAKARAAASDGAEDDEAPSDKKGAKKAKAKAAKADKKAAQKQAKAAKADKKAARKESKAAKKADKGAKKKGGKGK